MAFEKQQPQAIYQREKYDLYDPSDKKEIVNFEEELRPYMKKNLILFGRALRGFEIYLHENGLYVYSMKYPEGAVRMDKLEEYKRARMKYSALTELWDMRRKAQDKEAERVQALI